ncbi:Hypothetical protein NCS54_00191300 [Fusarium falciforme]|uniref:Hypothetical protein n=1 Tax=Fusarium falciforme TaxID=195108 RepID=UPI0022FFCC4F|nr:Hypothetical protein NCS54_00191300 [Fusarium falciforme]WAO84691.1 Hypothetical protein NCS54_00191300 [Fusarium falciforme]
MSFGRGASSTVALRSSYPVTSSCGLRICNLCRQWCDVLELRRRVGTVDELKSLNPGISCPDIDTDGLYCLVGAVNDEEPTTIVPSSTTREPGNGIETPSPIQEGMVSNCNKFHLTSPTATCEGVLNYHKISLADFVKWNPAVGKDCGGLWAGTNACVGVVGDKPSPTTTAGNGLTTSTPIQAGMVKNCIKFRYISPTTTCQGVLSYNKITMEQFAKWNPALKLV